MNEQWWLSHNIGTKKIVYLKKITRLASVLVFGYLYYYYFFPFLHINREIFPVIAFVYFMLLITVSGYAPFAGKKHLNRIFWLLGFFILSLFFILPFAFMQEAFGTFDINSLLITFSENDAAKLAGVVMDGFVWEFLRILGVIILVTTTAVVLLRTVHLSRVLVGFCAALPFAFGPPSQYMYQLIFPTPAHALIDVRNAVAPPRLDTIPETKKNLVFIYLESMERTYRVIPATQASFSTFSELEDNGLSFRNIRQIMGTNLTIAGMIATQCGVPLLSKGIFNIKKISPIRVDRLPDIPDFLKSVTCLGDVLTSDGYNATYINGSNLAIYSKGNFYRSHGYQRVLGLQEFPGWEDEPRQNIWGMNDDLLFERVGDELRRLAALDAPFLLTALTIATHGPDGYPDDSCPALEGSEKSGIPRVIACTGSHVEHLLNEIDQLGISDNTLVVITSDHLAHQNTLSRQLKEKIEARRNYVTVLGSQKTGGGNAGGLDARYFPNGS